MNNRYYLSVTILIAFVTLAFIYLFTVKNQEPKPAPQFIYVDTFAPKKEVIIEKQKQTNNYYETTFYNSYRVNPTNPELFNRAIQRHKYIDSVEASKR